MANKATFGCGDFLPGFGPGGFDDYDPPQDEVEEPIDPDWDVDPIDGDPIDPQRPPGGGGPGGGDPSGAPPQGPATPGPTPTGPPGGGGPDTPGPPGPQPPGGSGESTCKCVIEEMDTEGTIVPGAPAGYTRKKYVIKSKCKPRGVNQDTGNEKKLDDWKKDRESEGGVLETGTTNPPPDKNCSTPEGCTGPCPRFIFYYLFFDGPVTPGPPGPGAPGGGGDSPPDGPDGPSTGPRPGPSAPPGSGGGGGGGGSGGGGPSTGPPPGPSAPPGSGGGGGGGGGPDGPSTGPGPGVTPPGGPGTPGGGGGPTTPGPGTSVTPPGGSQSGTGTKPFFACMCTIASTTTTYLGPATGSNGQTGQQYSVLIDQECRSYNLHDPDDRDRLNEEKAKIDDELNAANDRDDVSFINGDKGDIGGSCRENGECTGECETILYTYIVPDEDPPEPPDDIDPSGFPGGNDGISTSPGGSQTNTDTGLGAIVDTDNQGGFTSNGLGQQGNFNGVQTPDGTGGGLIVNGLDANGNNDGFIWYDDDPNTDNDDSGNDSNGGLDGQIIGGGVYLPDWLLGGYSSKETDDQGGGSAGGLSDSVSQAIRETLEAQNPEGTEEMVLNLDDPLLVNYFARNIPNGLLDPDIALTSQTRQTIFVTRGSLRSDVFAEKVHESVYVVGVGQRRLTPWDDRTVFGLTTENVLNSLTREFLDICFSIKKSDGEFLSRDEVAAMVRNRLIDRTTDEIDVGYLRSLATRTRENKTPTFRPSSKLGVNELAAVSFLEARSIPLDPNELQGKAKEVVKNWKVLATDVAKYLPIVCGGEVKKYYIKDTDQFIDRSTLTIKDGDCYTIFSDGKPYRLDVLSEKDHAYIHRQEDRQRALKLLGSDGYNILSVSSDASANVEFDYSTSTPRENFYVFSAGLDNIRTEHTLKNKRKSQLIKTTTIKFDLVDISTDEKLDEFNEYIKYKVNGRTLFMDDDDRALDHMLHSSSLTYTQDDILFDVAKTNKGIPLFTRQIPWYIVIVPTNRFEYNMTRSKSRLTDYDPSGLVIRRLAYKPATDPQILKDISLFVDNSLAGVDGTDVYGDYVPRARNSSIRRNKRGLTEGYRRGSEFISAQEHKPERRKSGFRVIREIIREINNNYLLDDEGLELGVNTFDVVSRMDFDEYLRFISQDNPRLIVPRLKEGAIENVHLYNPINRAGTNAAKKTRLVQRRSTATEDTFVPIKYMRSGRTVLPPGTDFNSSEISTDQKRRPTR